MPAVVRRRLFGRFASLFPQGAWLPRSLRTRSTWRNLATDSATAHGLSIATLSPHRVRELLDPDFARQVGDYDPLDHVRRFYLHCDAADHLSKCRYVDICLGLADGILTKVDRASMAWGLEVRSPMLDHRFVEAAWQIPPRLLIRRRQGKTPLRRAVARQLGPAVANRPKGGFDMPLDEWFGGPLRRRFEDGPLGRGGMLHEWISPAAIGRLWHTAGRTGGFGASLWKLTMLDAWSRLFCGAAIEPRRSSEAPACIP